MDVAALALSVDSKDVVSATTDLDKFAKSADKAATSTGKMSGSGNTAKLAADYARAAQTADMASSAVTKAAAAVGRADAAMRSASASSAAVRAANDNVTRSFVNADAQVIAYREHLLRLVAAQNAQTQSAAANATASKAAATASGTAATGVVAVGVASRTTSAIASGLAGILGGLGGVIIGTVVTAVIEMTAKMFDNADSLKTAELAATSYSNVQSVLGEMFDLTTGKIKAQNEALRFNIQLTAINLRASAMAAEKEAQAAERASGQRSWSGWLTAKRPGRLQESHDTLARRNLQGVMRGTMDPAEVAKWAEKADFSGVNISAQEYLQALAKVIEVRDARGNAAKIEESLATGKLDKSFLQEDSGTGRAARTAGAGRTASRSAAISDEARALQERTRATDQYITSMEEEVAKIGLSEEALRKYEVAQALSRATTDAQREAIVTLSAEREKALITLRQTQELEAAKKALETTRQDITGGVDIELQTMGLVGAERDREVLRIQRQIEMTDLLAKIKAAEADGNVALADTYRQLAETIDENYAKKIQVIDGQERIERQTRAIADARDMAKGFFSDWKQGIRDGDNFFKAFANSVISSLNRMIDRMMDGAIDAFFDKFDRANRGGGGGFWSKLLDFGMSAAMSYAGGGAKGINSGSSIKASFKNANGNAFTDSGVMRFAMGGAFTNSIVTSPTLFRYAKGAAIGEMGEEGPEAVMPLTRLPNGKLGVHAQGGGASGRGPINVTNEITNNYKVDGGFMPQDVLALIRQGGEQTVSQVRRQLQSMLEQLDRDGTIVE